MSGGVWPVGSLWRVNVAPVEPMAPATVEVDLGGDAGAAADELETGCGGEEGPQCF